MIGFLLALAHVREELGEGDIADDWLPRGGRRRRGGNARTHRTRRGGFGPGDRGVAAVVDARVGHGVSTGGDDGGDGGGSAGQPRTAARLLTSTASEDDAVGHAVAVFVFNLASTKGVHVRTRDGAPTDGRPRARDDGGDGSAALVCVREED